MIKDDKGKISTMRLIALMSSFLGFGVVVCGVILAFMNRADALGIIGLGAGMLTSAQGFKALQKNVEKN